MSQDIHAGTVRAYTGTAKALHWLIALIVLVMLIFGWTLGDLPEKEHIETLVIHSSLGVSVLVLMTARLIWRLTHPAPALPADLPRWQVVLSKAVHHSLYLFLFLQPIWGIGQSLFAGFPVSPFGLGPLQIEENEQLFGIFHTAHAVNAMILIALLVLHIPAALYHHFIRKDVVLRRMLPFAKV
jgi:cytochrome b561